MKKLKRIRLWFKWKFGRAVKKVGSCGRGIVPIEMTLEFEYTRLWPTFEGYMQAIERHGSHEDAFDNATEGPIRAALETARRIISI